MENCEFCTAPFLKKRKKQRFCTPSCARQARSVVDHWFFHNPTLINSYYAGFIAADGCIVKSDRHSPVLRVQLISTDDEWLKNMLIHLKSDRSVKYYENNGYLQGARSARISIASRQIAEDLKDNFNIGSGKTYNLEPPKELSRDCELAYIAGLIDGDGSYTFSSKNNRPVLDIVGTEPVLSWVQKVVGCGSVRPRKNSPIFVFTCSGDDAIRVRDLFIDMNLPFLKRKYRRWESLGLNLSILNRGKPEHGTPNMYKHYGCRCQSCREAINKYQSELLKKKEVKK